MIAKEIFTATDSALFALFGAALGAVIGSFLNVIIHRVPRGESIVMPRSRCPQCGTAIRPQDNIPVLSYLVLGGRCRACRAPISARYPLVEALTAALFAVAFARVGLTMELAFDLAFIAVVLALIFIDAEHMLLPNAITYPGFIMVLAARTLVPRVDLVNLHGYPLWANSLIGALAGAAFGAGTLWLARVAWRRLRGVEAMGLGDVKMMLMIGAYLGLPRTAVAMFLAFVIGAAVGIAVMFARGERDLQMMLPFGIFLGVGAMVALFFGDALLSWYLQFFF
ncbi:MAG: prepilin peptidase [Pyrinomonas sp.]|uniref:prepilin peptidase n=1 Tax=Pyrinomonas sp. TaxID=2080306 RepID=UPI00331B0191